MKTALRVGSVVRPRGDPREMIVVDLERDGLTRCVWFTGTDRTSSARFARNQLDLIDNTAPPLATFTPGDVVQLAIDGPHSMTVVNVEADGIECAWFSGFDHMPDKFDVRMLRLIRTNDDKVGVDRGPMVDRFDPRILWPYRKTQDKSVRFDAGDEVTLRSGGPVMLVERGGDTDIHCVSDSFGRVTFDARAIQLFSTQGAEIAAHELLAAARSRGLDLDSLCSHSAFSNKHRSVLFWFKTRSGSVYYNMQGAVSRLPAVLKDSGSAFRGMWSEAGYLEDTEAALAFLRAWLLDRHEIDELPTRSTMRYGFC